MTVTMNENIKTHLSFSLFEGHSDFLLTNFARDYVYVK